MESFNFLASAAQSLNSQNQLNAASRPLAPSDQKALSAEAKAAELKKGAKAFEAYFVQSLLKEMRKTINKSDGAELGYGGDIYQSMFDEAIANKMTDHGGIGLAEVLLKNLHKKP